MYETNYHKAASATDAASILERAEDGRLLAGGQTLIPTMKQRLADPTDLVDISAVADLKGITIAKSDGRLEGGETITIGAMTTHAQVAQNSKLAAVCPSLCALAGNIGDPAVRHRGTIGGSLANNDPAADYPAAMLALGAIIHTNSRDIPASNYFTGMFSTDLYEHEIITSISFQAPASGGYSKFPNPASRYAMAGVFVAKMVDGSVCVAVTGAGEDGVFRHPGLEAALRADWLAQSLDDVSISPVGLLSDMHGDAVYRANLVKVMAKRALG